MTTHVAMLWCDTSQADLAAKIRRGARHYELRHSRRPTRVTVHPTMIPRDFAGVDGVELKTSKIVEPSYLLFAFDEPTPEAA